MSLFAHSYEYQRSFDRIWKDFSDAKQAPTEPGLEEVESTRHRSARTPGSQGEVFVQNNTQDAIAPQVVGGSELMQFDAKAWGRFLDSKRKK